MVSNMTLVKIAALGGIATVSMGIALRSKLNHNIKDAEYCKEALKLLRTHKGAVHLLGEPIKDRTIDVGNTKKNFIKDNSVKYEIPVSGTKQKGVLHLWANRKSEGSEWVLESIELGLNNEPDRRLLIKAA